MPVETLSLFTRVIQDHLELKTRNAALEGDMPLHQYMSEDPFDNHPLFKTEEQARLEETMDGELAVPAAIADLSPSSFDTVEHPAVEGDDGLWSRSRDFDWGD